MNRKIATDLIISTAIFLIAFLFIPNLSLRGFGEVFVMVDKEGDDNGAGKIKYPTSLIEKENIFDIKKFTVSKEKDIYSFEYKLSNLIEDVNTDKGFSDILIDTYISVDDKGYLTTLEYGPAINFAEEHPWKYHIRISPKECYLETAVDVIERTSIKKDLELIIDTNKITVNIDKVDIKENLADSRYYVFTGGFDIFGSDHYREVVSKESEYDFYGGIDSVYQPNILDVVSPIQKDMLAYFMPPQYAILVPVFNQLHQRIFRREILYILISACMVLKYMSAFKKIKSNKVSKAKDK